MERQPPAGTLPPTSTRGSHCSAETLSCWNCLSLTHCRLLTTSAAAPNASQVRHRPAEKRDRQREAERPVPAPCLPCARTLPPQRPPGRRPRGRALMAAQDLQVWGPRTQLPPRLVGLSMREATTIRRLMALPSLAARSWNASSRSASGAACLHGRIFF